MNIQSVNLSQKRQQNFGMVGFRVVTNNHPNSQALVHHAETAMDDFNVALPSKLRGILAMLMEKADGILYMHPLQVENAKTPKQFLISSIVEPDRALLANKELDCGVRLSAESSSAVEAISVADKLIGYMQNLIPMSEAAKTETALAKQMKILSQN